MSKEKPVEREIDKPEFILGLTKQEMSLRKQIADLAEKFNYIQRVRATIDIALGDGLKIRYYENETGYNFNIQPKGKVGFKTDATE